MAIEVLFNICEEAGMYGAKYLNRSDIKSEFGFIFDCQASPGSYIIEAPEPTHLMPSFMEGLHMLLFHLKRD